MPYATYGFGAQIAEVEVDLELGTVKLLRIVAAHDVGQAINPTLVEGQIEGGIAQGIGMALMEEYLPGPHREPARLSDPDHRRRAARSRCILIEDREPLGPFGAKGVGEPALIPTAPAILNAIHHATGVRMHARAGDAASRCARRSCAAREHERAMSDEHRRSAEAETHGRHRALRCLPGAVPHRPGKRRRLRPLRQRRRQAGARRSAGAAGQAPTWRAVAFVEGSEAWRRRARQAATAPSSPASAPTTTYPDYKPAPFIVSSQARRRRHGHRRDRGHLQLLRRQGEDRHRPPSRPRAGDGARQGRGGRPRHHGRIRLADAVARRRASPHRRQQEGRRRHLRRDAGARATARPVELTIDGGATVVVQAGQPPVVNGAREERMRVGCGSATIGMFAQQWHGHVDEVVVVDDHITGVLTEHQAGKLPRHEARRHPRARPQVDAGPLLPGRRARASAGAAPTSPIRWRSSRGSIPKHGLARPAAADGLDHRRAFGVVRARRGPEAASRPRCRRRCATSSSASARTASRRCAPCCSSPAPAARCAPASPRTRCG